MYLKLRLFKSKLLSIILPIIDETTGNWQRRHNKELYDMLELTPVTSFIEGQRIQWLGHFMRRRDDETEQHCNENYKGKYLEEDLRKDGQKLKFRAKAINNFLTFSACLVGGGGVQGNGASLLYIFFFYQLLIIDFFWEIHISMGK